jgi:hypothetical protein
VLGSIIRGPPAESSRITIEGVHNARTTIVLDHNRLFFNSNVLLFIITVCIILNQKEVK